MEMTNPLKLAYARQFPGEVAIHLAAAGRAEIERTLAGLPAEVAAAVVARLPHAQAMQLLSAHSDAAIVDWLNAATLDHAVALLRHVEQPQRERILQQLSSRRKRRNLKQLTIYPRDAVGALVNPSAMSLQATTPLSEALALLRSSGLKTERSIWLVDGDGGYRGLLDPGRALTARSDQLKLDAFLVRIKALRAETMLINARDSKQWLEHVELPVVDETDHLLGSITRARLVSALDDSGAVDPGLVDGMRELTQQYFRIMSICLGDLFGARATGATPAKRKKSEGGDLRR